MLMQRWASLPSQILQMMFRHKALLHVDAFEGTEVCNSLLVQNLPRKVDFKTIHKHFSQFGNVDNLRLVQPESAPIVAYVTYKRKREAVKAFDTHSETPFRFTQPCGTGAKTAEIAFAPKQRYLSPLYKQKVRYMGHSHFADKPQLPSRTLYVGNIHYKSSVQNVEEYFSFWGKVDRVKMMKDKLGQTTGVAFVRFATAEEAMACWRHPRRTLRKRKLVVEFPKAKGEHLEAYNQLLEEKKLDQREPGRAQSLVDFPLDVPATAVPSTTSSDTDIS